MNQSIARARELPSSFLSLRPIVIDLYPCPARHPTIGYLMRYLLVTLTMVMAGWLRAELVFDQDPVQLKPKPEDDEIETTFTFKNGGSKPLHVTGLESSCSCLEATLDKSDYAPGEKGKGQAKFKVSSFVGKHEKFLHIYTDDPAHPDQVLTAVIDVPVVVEIEPKLLQWIIGDAAEAKEFTIKMIGQDPMKIKEVKATRQNVTFELKEVKPGREYTISLKPTTTANITVGALQIETDAKIPKYQHQMAFFSIVRPEQVEKQVKD